MEHHEELKAKVEYRDGIVYMRHYPGALLDRDDMERIIDFQQKLTRHKKYALLLDLRGHVTVTDAAAEISSRNPNADNLRGVAVIAQKGLAFKGASPFALHKPDIHTRVFLNEDEARHWLKSLS